MSGLVDDALLALLQGRASILVGTRDAALQPHVMRAIACRVGADRRRVTLLMTARTSAQALDDIRANGQVAAVFTLPSSHRSVQIKGSDAVVEPIEPGDLALVDAHARRFADEIGPLGFAPALARAILDRDGSDLVAVTFSPREAYDQTPGPRAGEPLDAAR